MARSVLAAMLGAAALALSLTGCSGAGDTTCQEYAEMGLKGQTSELRSLLSSHDLDPDSSSNIAGVTQAVANLCGSTVMLGQTSNPDAVLDDAADWEATTW